MKVFLIFASLLISLTTFATATKFIYATSNNEEGRLIYINTLETWNEAGALTDGYSEEERAILDPILDEASLCEVMESTYEACGGKEVDFKKALRILKKYKIYHSKPFQKFIDNE